MYDISTPIITVAGMGEKTNKMELQMDLVISLQKTSIRLYGYPVEMRHCCIMGRNFRRLCMMREYQKRKNSNV